jgi:predicted HTH domain antitoxin
VNIHKLFEVSSKYLVIATVIYVIIIGILTYFKQTFLFITLVIGYITVVIAIATILFILDWYEHNLEYPNEETEKFLKELDYEELILYLLNNPKLFKGIKKEVMEKRKEIALRMLKEKKISLGLASELAGVNYFEMLDEAIKNGIKPFSVEGDI